MTAELSLTGLLMTFQLKHVRLLMHQHNKGPLDKNSALTGGRTCIEVILLDEGQQGMI